MAGRFGALLRQWRLRAGLSQEALAQRAEVGIRTIRGLETGERSDPRVGTVRLLADALELTGAERAELFTAAGRAEPVAEAVSPVSDPPASAAELFTAAGRAESLAEPGEPAVDLLAPAVESLAAAVRAQWQREEEQRQVHDPVPLPVRWEPADAALRDSWVNICRAKPGERVADADLSGQLDQIVEVYQRIPSRRLVVLGRAGSGKTILTMRFVLDLLATRRQPDPVPVIFSLGSWQPDRIGLRDWLADQLTRDHPALAAPGPGAATLAAALVDGGRVLPVLDGFDEIAEGLHRAALVALNSTALPLVLTSRVDEYRDAVAGTDVLTAGAAVVLADLTADDLADYLPRTTRKTGVAGNAWKPVLEDVRERPSGALASVLTTPLMVALARRIYSDTPDHDPVELLALGADELERHLLGEFVPAVFPGAQVTSWLGYLADHLTRLGTHDLAWWQLGTSAPVRSRASVVALGVGVVVGVADMVIEALVTGTVSARLILFGILIGVVTGGLFGLVHGHVVRAHPLEPARTRMRLRGWSVGPAVWARLRLGVLFAGAIGAGYGLVRALALWLVSSSYRMSIGVLVDVGVFAVVFGVGGGLIFALVAALEVPLDTRSAESPEGLLRANRTAVFFQMLLFVPLFAFVVAAGTGAIVSALLAFPSGSLGFDIAWTPLAGLSLGLVGGLGGGLAYVLGLTAWGQWLVFARFWLPLTGRLPWDTPAFLADAYRRGVLRRAGAVYQFRHARLQEHLTALHRSSRRS